MKFNLRKCQSFQPKVRSSWDPPGGGSYQLPNIGFIGNVFFLMVTSNPNMAHESNIQVLTKETSFTHLLLLFCEFDGARTLFLPIIYQLIDLG